MDVTAAQLRAIMPKVPDNLAEEYARCASSTADRFQITTPMRLAAWLANIAYESDQLRGWNEYGGGRGEFGVYYGRGPLQLTHYENYLAAGSYLQLPLVANPDLVSDEVQVGFDTAGWYWRFANGDLNVFADQGDLWECYIRILGGDNGSYPQRKAFYDRALEVLQDGTIPDNESGETMGVTGQDIVRAAYEVLGAPYRTWHLGMSLPTWLDDNRGDPPPASHLLQTGLECADLVAYALARNGLPYPYQAGTGSFEDFLVNVSAFDPSSPGVPGAVALRPYEGPEWEDQGHIGIYVDENLMIQALARGVTDQFTDAESWGWGGSTEFTLYGFLPGVDYGSVSPVEPAPAELWQKYGWYTYESEDSWNLRYYPPTLKG